MIFQRKTGVCVCVSFFLRFFVSEMGIKNSMTTTFQKSQTREPIIKNSPTALTMYHDHMKYYLAPDSALHSPPYSAPYSKI